MNKKFLTQTDRLESLKKRSELIKESFKGEFNKIKRIDEHVLDGASTNDFTNWFAEKIEKFAKESYYYGNSMSLESKVIEYLYTIGQKVGVDTKIIRKYLSDIQYNHLTTQNSESNNYNYDDDDRDTSYDSIDGDIHLFNLPIIGFSSGYDGYGFQVDTNIDNLTEAIKQYIELITKN